MKLFQIALKKKKMGCIEAKNNCSCGRKISIKMNGKFKHFRRRRGFALQ